MAWHADLTGGYAVNSTEAIDNYMEMNGLLNARNYSLAAQAGIIANSLWEGGLNPWRWGDDQSGSITDGTKGYGLFQFTPPDKYINQTNATDIDIAGYYAPNLSTSAQTPTARPYDGGGQTIFFDKHINIPGNWFGWCWRPSWDSTDSGMTTVEIAQYQAIRDRILATWGTDGYVSVAQFKQVTVPADATFIILSAFEGPRNPLSYPNRANDADIIYQNLSGDTPPSPPTPTPTGRTRKMPLWMYLRRY